MDFVLLSTDLVPGLNACCVDAERRGREKPSVLAPTEN
jgi:hypothetical protein